MFYVAMLKNRNYYKQVCHNHLTTGYQHDKNCAMDPI